jgi:hypothetical protein
VPDPGWLIILLFVRTLKNMKLKSSVDKYHFKSTETSSVPYENIPITVCGFYTTYSSYSTITGDVKSILSAQWIFPFASLIYKSVFQSTISKVTSNGPH